VDTRLDKLKRGDFDAIVLAEAGLKRLNVLPALEGVTSLNPTEFLPAPSQGALALEVREKDSKTREAIKDLEDSSSALQVKAERAFLRRLEGGCQIPAGVYSQIQHDDLIMAGGIFSQDGSDSVRWTTHGDKKDPEAVGIHLAEWLLQSGGDEILKKIRNGS